MDAGIRNCLPSVNQFCCRIGDINNKGILAYGSCRSIVIAKMMNVPLLFCGVKDAHLRVIGVRFNPFYSNTLATAGTDSVKIWQLQGKEMELRRQHAFQHLSSIEWSSFQSEIIYVSDDDGITRWDTNKDTKERFPCGDRTHHITMLAQSHVKPYLLAVSHKNGSISLLDIHMQFLKKLCGHQQTLMHITWSVNSNKLLTSSSDGTVRVWTIGNTQEESDSYVCYDWNKPFDLDCMPLAVWHPTKDNAIIVTTPNGHIGELDLNVKHEREIEIYENANGPDNKLFLCVFSKQLPAFYTYSRDRMLTLWSVQEKAAVAEIFTVRSMVKSLSFPPISTGLSGTLAMAAGEKSLVFWDTASDSKTFRAKHYWKNIASPVVRLAWNPKNKDVIAFATVDGDVAIIENWKRQNKLTYCNLKHEKEVACLCWGPCAQITGSSTDQLALFSCGAGKILIHFMDKSLNFSEVVSSEEKKRFVSINWKDDFSLFATGSTIGVVNIYNGETYELYMELCDGSWSVPNLLWHPKFYLEDGIEKESTIHCWLAVSPVNFGTRKTEIVLYDVTDELLTKKPHERVVQSLGGFSTSVSCLAWNPHFEELLAAGSEDWDVSVWNAITSQLLFKFIGHFSSVLSVAWSPIDKNLLFSGSCNFTLLCLDQHALRSQQQQTGICVRKNYSKVNNGHGVVIGSVDECDESAELEEPSLVPMQKSSIITEKSHPATAEADAADDQQLAADEGQPEEPPDEDVNSTVPENCEFMLPFLSSKLYDMRFEELMEYIRLLDSYLRKDASDCSDGAASKLGEGKLKYFGLFGDKEDMQRMIESESNSVNMTASEKVQFDVWWKHDLKKLVEEFIKSETIPDELLQYAPEVSKSLWKTVCKAYIETSECEDLYKKVALLFALRKPREAITLLKDKDIVFALIIARACCVDEEDPLLNEVIESFKKQLLEEKLETFALCKYQHGQ